MTAILQPDDSKRVADEIIKALQSGIFDISSAVKTVLEDALRTDIGRESLGGAIADAVQMAVMLGMPDDDPR